MKSWWGVPAGSHEVQWSTWDQCLDPIGRERDEWKLLGELLVACDLYTPSGNACDCHPALLRALS
jgi:hypothetical protein